MEVPKGQILEAVVNALVLIAQILPQVWMHVQLPMASLIVWSLWYVWKLWFSEPMLCAFKQTRVCGQGACAWVCCHDTTWKTSTSAAYLKAYEPSPVGLFISMWSVNIIWSIVSCDNHMSCLFVDLLSEQAVLWLHVILACCNKREGSSCIWPHCLLVCHYM